MLLERLSQRAIAVRLDDVPEDGLAIARLAILDTVGVTLAGASEPCTRIAERALGAVGKGSASLFGRSAMVGPLDAATINGTASHALHADQRKLQITSFGAGSTIRFRGVSVLAARNPTSPKARFGSSWLRYADRAVAGGCGSHEPPREIRATIALSPS